MIKVAIHNLPLNSGHNTRGIGFYTKNLIESLKSEPNIEVSEFSNILDLTGVDIIHYPYFDFYKPTLILPKKIPTVVTIHDIIPLLFSKHYPPGIKGKINHFRQKYRLKGVKKIITDSDSSRSDIIKYFRVNPLDVVTTHLAVSSAFKKIEDQQLLDTIRKRNRLPEKFALYTGSVNWNKNLLNISQACISAGIDLVLVGRDFEDRKDLNHPERQTYKLFLEKYAGLHSVHIRGYVDLEDLVGMYNLASVVMLPSFYEGFGLPILEAQACGAPVITSNLSSMPEVAGDGAILVDPTNPFQISEKIKVLLSDKQKVKELIEEGFKNTAKYSWQKTARETIKVYEQVLSNK